MKSERIAFLSVLIFVVLASQNNVAAQTASESEVFLGPVKVTARLFADGTTVLELVAQVNNLGGESIETLSLRIDSLDIELIGSETEGLELDATLIARDRYTEAILSLPVPIESNNSRVIEMELLVRDLQSVQSLDPSSIIRGDFTYYIRPSSVLANFTFTIILPPTAILSQLSAVPLYPSSDANWTDGSSLSFSWFTSELQPGQERVYIVKYQLDSTLTIESNFIIELLLFTLAGIAIGALLTVGLPKIAERIRVIGSVRIAGITHEEGVLLDVMRRKGGSCPQKELYTEFDMSQSRVSLTLTNLEQRGLIRRIREGRVNMVYVVDES